MTDLRYKFINMREKKQVSWETIEQDYLLSWVLAGIASERELKEILIFKGGTALKKCYFGDYRFSQDLDFSVLSSLPEDNKLDQLLENACTRAMNLQSEKGYPLIIKSERYSEKKPHPHDQKAFTILGQYPWHRQPFTRVMVEITAQEAILLPFKERKIIHDYEENLHAFIKTYQLEEIVAEKIRAILQYAIKLHERGWGRSRARDYYDLWRILTTYADSLQIHLIPDLVSQKCAVKDIHFKTSSDLFSPQLMENLEEAWEEWLNPYVPGLANKNIVIKELKACLERIWVNKVV